jgi:putative copper export protein
MSWPEATPFSDPEPAWRPPPRRRPKLPPPTSRRRVVSRIDPPIYRQARAAAFADGATAPDADLAGPGVGGAGVGGGGPGVGGGWVDEVWRREQGARRSSARRARRGRLRGRSRLAGVAWALGGGVGLAWACLVLVVLRTEAVDAAWAGMEAERAVAETLVADRVLSVLQWVLDVATTLVLGGLIFRALVGRGLTRAGAQTGLLRVAARAGAVAALASLVPRAVALSGQGLAASWDATAVGAVAGSRFGTAALLRAAGFALLGSVALAPARDGAHRRRRAVDGWGLVGATVGGASVVAGYVLTGHPRATSPAAPLVVAQCVHLLTVSAWFGGVTCLALELRRLRRQRSSVELAAVVRRFSNLATASVAVAAATGLLLAASQIDLPGELTATAYGRALAAKLAAVSIPLALGGYNAVRLVPALSRAGPEAAWQRLQRTVVAEAVVLALGVLVLTAAMTTGGF